MSTNGNVSDGPRTIIDHVKADHSRIRNIYTNFVNAPSYPLARRWFNQFVREVSKHSVAEELLLYPMLAEVSTNGQTLADQARMEQHALKKDLISAQKLANNWTALTGKMKDIMTELSAHIEKEESDDLPLLYNNIDSAKLEKAGRMFLLKKKIVPTRPHPNVPEKPVLLEAMLGLMIMPFDKMRDVFTRFPAS